MGYLEPGSASLAHPCASLDGLCGELEIEFDEVGEHRVGRLVEGQGRDGDPPVGDGRDVGSRCGIFGRRPSTGDVPDALFLAIDLVGADGIRSQAQLGDAVAAGGDSVAGEVDVEQDAGRKWLLPHGVDDGFGEARG